MRQKPLACVLLISFLAVAGCGEDNVRSKWFGATGSGDEAVHMEFGSYEECVAGMQSAAASGVFNCGVN